MNINKTILTLKYIQEITEKNYSKSKALGMMAIYDKMFTRYERPDDTIQPGCYQYHFYEKNMPRENVSFLSDNVKLTGYFYLKPKSKGLIIMAHGLHSGGDDYLPFIKYFYDHGFSVFSFNYKGTYESEGDGTVGMCESLVDLDHAIDFILQDPRFLSTPLFLFGHSWGGYAVSSVLSLKSQYISAVACVAPMNDGYHMILEKGQEFVGDYANNDKELLDIYQTLLFHDYTKYNGVEGINSCLVPVLIAQGITDKVITYKGQSITAHANEIINPHVTYYIGSGLQGGHMSILFSNEANQYQKEVDAHLKSLDDLEEKRKYIKTVNHQLYSQINEDLFKNIVNFYEKAL